MSNQDRPGKSIAFYSDMQTLERLDTMSELERRSVSNMLTVAINYYWDRHYQGERIAVNPPKAK